ncbi:S8 family serine peptidase [Saccharopolyspora indica]|uniref:S8 family serine peptidase n=1 Tax=Saccharopolyspora indica TaxID=1229659 RepID=UPI0022EAF66B|nr:S8 family serine peptidase [Saccharopolyspora indica]MDA3642845.1 S8 family serine peptidase [Saccharopolyspora indica]
MRAALVAAVLVSGFAVAPAASAQCASPAGVYSEPVGWAQRLTDASEMWPLADGSGQLVAVVGTGMDPGNAQFAPGQVVPGSDLGDCDGRGTFAAGIVGAQQVPGTAFAGMAPGARLLGIRYTETTTGGGAPSPNALAGAIGRAVDANATVVLVAVPASSTSPALEAAVRDALSRNAVVVSPAVGDEPEARSYPADLPGVLAVGALDESGAAVQGEAGDHLSIAAPGADLVGTSAGASGLGHRWGVDLPAFSAAYVAGAAALVRSYRPELDAKQVADRLARTASRPPNGYDTRLGWGVLDVRSAVTTELADDPSALELPPPAPEVPTVRPAAGPPPLPDHSPLPGWLALLGIAAAALAVVVRETIRRGRERGWRPGSDA